jgi:hypothetical protein
MIDGERGEETPPEDANSPDAPPLPTGLAAEVPVRRSSVSLNPTNASELEAHIVSGGGLNMDLFAEFEALREQVRAGVGLISKESKTNEDLRREIHELRTSVHRGGGSRTVATFSTIGYIHLGVIAVVSMIVYRLGIFALTYLEPVTQSSGLLADSEACGLCLATSTVVCGVLFGLAIPDSLDLSLKVGHAAAYSGRIVGTFPLGVAAGCFGMHKILKRRPALARERAKSALMISMSSLALGSVIYAVAADFAFRLPPASVTTTTAVDQRSYAMTLIFAGRCFGGFGAGTFYRFTAEAFAHLGWRTDKERVNRVKMYTLVSPCIGFLINGILNEATTQSLNPSTKNAVIIAAIACTHLAWVAYKCPQVDEGLLPSQAAEMGGMDSDGTRHSERSVQFDETSIRESAYSDHLINDALIYRVSCTCFGLLISYCLGSVEVVSLMILEANYCWQISRVAIAVGLTHLAVVPAIWYFDGAINKVTPVCIIRTTIAFALFATFCYVSLESVNCTAHVDVWHFMPLLGDLLSFPCLAVAFRVGMPPGSVWIETSGRSFQTLVFAMGFVLARSAAPIGARWWCDKAQDYFAFTQAC